MDNQNVFSEGLVQIAQPSRPAVVANSASKIFRVGLVQINTSFSGLNYFPYSVGILEAYARQHLADPRRYQFLVPIYARVRVQEAVEQLLTADIVAFSVYVWNMEISLAIARELKKRNPEVVIVFGGPHVPDRPTETAAFLHEHRFIDLACHGEGEKIFLAVLENFPSRNWQLVPSISYLDQNNAFHKGWSIERIKDLETIPSPYLEGIFDPLIARYPNERWIAMWETNRGCPFSCTFCGWGGAVNAKLNRWDLDRLLREVDWFADRDVHYISCADANFGILPRDVEIAKYVAEIKKRRGCFPGGLSVQNTKNATDRSYEVQKILGDAGLSRGVVLSMQSLDPDTLKNIKRDNISLGSYEELQRRFRQDGVETMTDIILGLPGETYDSFANGVSTLMDRGQHNRIQFNNLSVLPDAEMWDPEYRKAFGMKTIKSRIINIHGLKDDFDEVPEYQDLITETASMPRADWAKTRAFGWTAGLLHFDKVFQIPLIIAHEWSGISYRELLELFVLGSPILNDAEFPTLAEFREFFRRKAEDIQNGGEEFCHSAEWLDIWWPADEYFMIKLCVEGRLDAFYREAVLAIMRCIDSKSQSIPSQVLEDAAKLNRAMLKMPFLNSDLVVKLGWNVWDVYLAARKAEKEDFVPGEQAHLIDRTSERWSSWDEWCREVIWYGNKRGAYLYGNKQPSPQFAGHY